MIRGPVALVYWFTFVFPGILACAPSAAEMANVFSISGMRYHWTQILALREWDMFLLFMEGA